MTKTPNSVTPQRRFRGARVAVVAGTSRSAVVSGLVARRTASSCGFPTTEGTEGDWSAGRTTNTTMAATMATKSSRIHALLRLPLLASGASSVTGMSVDSLAMTPFASSTVTRTEPFPAPSRGYHGGRW